MIVAEHLTKSYGRQQVLRRLSMTARAGEVTLLIGSNGAGKTTTLRILAGLGRPDSGTATICGADVIRSRCRAQEQLAFLPQGVAFHPRFSCRQVLKFYARLRGVAHGRIDEVLQLVGLEAEVHKRVGALSGGLRQRLGLAVMLLPDTPVLLLDEPGISLDPEWRSRMQALLHGEAKRGKTVLVTTHLLAEWEGVGHRCLRCLDGRIEREIEPGRLRDSASPGVVVPYSRKVV